MNQPDLFGAVEPPAGPILPTGWHYAADFLSAGDEAAIISVIAGLDLQEAQYKAFTARRRVAHFGSSYDYEHNRLRPGPAIPPTLLPLRERAAAWAALPADAFGMALVAEYRPGTPLGWHRDVPDYDVVVGVSLGSPARMRFRRYPPVQPKKSGVLSLELAPGSIYMLRNEARWGWQHSVAPTAALRWSITFRTRRERLASMD